MIKVAFLHGFLGSSGDMTPFFIEGAENTSIDLRNYIFQDRSIEKISSYLENFDVLVGYSFGGRLLGEVKKSNVLQDKKWVFISSKHSPYTPEELDSRKLFKEELEMLIETDLQLFYEHWRALPLFSGHLMSDFREEYAIPYKPWTADEMLQYLNFYFNTEQFEPTKDFNVHYLYGEKDQKYSKEARALKNVFNVHQIKNAGHRALFEEVEQFKSKLKKICGL